ncbi:MAG: YdcF family protein [Limisphaerales bacterium]
MIRFLAPVAQPIGLLWLLMLVATLGFVRKRRWSGALVLLLFAGVIYVIGGTPLPAQLMASLERPYARETWSDVPVCDAVVMLGGAHQPSHYDVFGIDLTAASDRIITAVELMRQHKGGALVLGGGAYLDQGQKRGDGVLLEKWFTAWRLPVAPLFNLGANADTREEAVHFQALAKEHGWKRVILVTSGFHMKRAEATFRKIGVAVVPVACDFRAVGVTEKYRQFHLFPGREGFEQLELYLHEKLGWWVYSWRGWLEEGGAKSDGDKRHTDTARAAFSRFRPSDCWCSPGSEMQLTV